MYRCSEVPPISPSFGQTKVVRIASWSYDQMVTVTIMRIIIFKVPTSVQLMTMFKM